VDLAYLDAGSGSLIVQAVVAGAAGMAVAVKLYWRRLKGLFKRQPAEAPESAPAKAEAQTADRD
jgi:L-serine deaminase